MDPSTTEEGRPEQRHLERLTIEVAIILPASTSTLAPEARIVNGDAPAMEAAGKTEQVYERMPLYLKVGQKRALAGIAAELDVSVSVIVQEAIDVLLAGYRSEGDRGTLASRLRARRGDKVSTAHNRQVAERARARQRAHGA
jgi:hypothetical protein